MLYVRAQDQFAEGAWTYLRSSASIETSDFILRADEIDYNQETGYAEGRGDVRFQSFERGEEIQAERVEYFLREQKGRFYHLRGSSPPKVDYRPGLLMSSAPFVFEGTWAERIGGRYILHDGYITNCRTPRPWWRLQGSQFDIVPGERAIASNSRFVLKRMPLFFTPWFYKSLADEPRRSGLLMPNIGNSSRRGRMVGVGYFWAINRWSDLTYRTQLFTARGFAHHVDFRAKPNQNTDLDMIFYGVNDRGLLLDDGSRLKQGGYLFSFRGKSELPFGFHARSEINYLSSFVFRQSFTESFNEAVFSEVRSIGFATKQWSTYSLDLVFERSENYQSTEPGDRIVIRRLPIVEFRGRDRKVRKDLPIWVSLESSAGFLRRNQPLFQTRQFVDRIDFAPRVMTAFRWKGFSLLPAFSIRETHYGSSQLNRQVSGNGVTRSSSEVSADLIMPSLARVFAKPPKFLGEKLKHVIEPRASFRKVSGIGNFDEFVRFDDTELLSNTTEIDYSLTNRLYTKTGSTVREIASWQLWQKRYLDPDFGGALIDGGRNVLRTQTEMTAFSFIDQSRRFSPVVSVFRVSPVPAFQVDWRSDYDPTRSRIVNSSLIGSWRRDKLVISAGHSHVRSIPSRFDPDLDRYTGLSPNANQFIGLIGWGSQNRRGWSAGFQSVYDFRTSQLQFATTQVSYNSECCGISVQYRRFGFGTRNENQFRVAFAVANIGSFGTLRRQESIF
ncbi:MAG: LPS assembly protein LptD [Bryobacteraceae bacterium]